MSKRLKFKKTLGRKTKIKLKKSRSNDKRNMPNKLNQQANSYSKTEGDKNIDESFMSFECLDNINDCIPQESLNIPEIQNAKANDPFIENNKLP